MKIRKEFSEFVAARTGRSVSEVETGSFAFPLTENGPAETRLAQPFEILDEFQTHYSQDADEIRKQPGSSLPGVVFQALDPSGKPRPAIPADPSDPFAVASGLCARVEQQLGYPVVPLHIHKGSGEVFSADLHRQAVDVDDLLPGSVNRTQPRGILFLDPTPGEPGGVGYFEALAKSYPALTPEQRAADPGSVAPRPGAVRQEVQAWLDVIATATRVGNHQARLDGGRAFEFFRGNAPEPVAELRIQATPLDPMGHMVPGITRLREDDTVSLAVDPKQPHTERLELGGEERKALLHQLYALEKGLPAIPEGLQITPEYLHHESLWIAQSKLAALVSQGDLGFYDRIVTQEGDAHCWLSRVRSGQSVTL